MDGYYDHGPLLQLQRPVVITGPWREFTRAVTYRTSSMLGLPFHDIDRLVEHRSGRVLQRLVLEEGVSAYRDAEAVCLEDVLRQRPSGMIALADQDRPLRVGQATGAPSDYSLIILDFELANLYWRIQKATREKEASHWHPLFDGIPHSVDELRPFWSAWRRVQPEAGRRLSTDTLTVAETSDWLQRWLRESTP